MSFSRPDPASPAQVADASFSTGRRGFDQDEVREFLRMVAAELGRMHERERFLERELRTAQTSPDLDSARLDDEALTRLLGEETARVLNAARESANEIRAKAEQAAARMLTEASDEATRLREEAEIEASRRRADAANDAEAELSMAKQQGREMVNEARAYRERVLSELARRRELAREQIEQLVHGRDRLMQAFERARLVAVDIVAEMQPLGEPDEYVNLQPTTGPVPVMVAREQVEQEIGAAAAVVETGDADDDDSSRNGDASDDGDGSRPGDASGDGQSTGDVGAPDDDGVREEDLGDDDRREADRRDDLRVVDDAEPHDIDDAQSCDLDALEPDATPGTAEAGGRHDVDGVGSIEDGTTRDDNTAGDGNLDEPETTAATPGDGNLDEPETTAATPGDGSPDDPVTSAATPDDDATPSEARTAEALDADRGEDQHNDDNVVVDLFARLRHAADDPGDGGTDSAESEGSPSIPSTGDISDAETADTADDTESVETPWTADTADDTESVDTPGTAETAEDANIVEAPEFEQRDADLTPLIVASARKLKRVLADEQNEVLDALRRSDPVKNLDAMLPWASEHATRYSTAIGDDLLLAAQAGASLATPGRVAKLRKAAGKQAVEHAGGMVEQWLVGSLRDRLERCVSEGDGDNATITKKVRAVYREWKTQHIDEQLDDILRAANGRGVLAAFPPDSPIRWVPDPRHDWCPDCDDNSLAGAVAAGQPFPTGHTFAPAHRGCRCMLLPAAP